MKSETSRSRGAGVGSCSNMYYNNLGKFARQLNLILCSIDNMRLYLYDGM